MNDTECPKVSVVIPAYNNAKTIVSTIESVKKQTYKNLEIIIIDDNSQDNTLQIIKEKQKEDNRIKIVHNENNLGMTENWNKCLGMAEGEFIKLVCADDLLDEKAIEKETTAMIKNPTVNLVESDTRLVDIYGKQTGVFKRYPRKGLVNGSKVAKSALIWNNFFGAPVNNLFRKSVLEKTGGFDRKFTYILDFDMWLKIANTGDVYIIHELLNSFRIRDDSNTGKLIGSNRDIYVEEHRQLIEKYADKLKLSKFEIKFSIFFRKFRNIVIGVYLSIFTK